MEQALGRPLLLKELVFWGDEGQGYVRCFWQDQP